ncbi:MAG TPA: hypothetical protein VFS31_17630 [Chitinophagaceae bacterium]|nr:hypothetical protein [Chitinophagaceae bacterium]
MIQFNFSIRCLLQALFCMLIPVLIFAQPAKQKPEQISGGLKGYISMRIHPPKEDGYGYGISFYTSAWPLIKTPLANFQIGLPSTWIVPDNKGYTLPLCPVGTIARDNWPKRGPSYGDVFETIEGGLGFWQSTRFGSGTPKYRINGTPNCYNTEISSPGWGFGKTDPLAEDQMGLAQLSNHVIIPPDGLTLSLKSAGDLIGNAWMVLPLTEPVEKTTDSLAATGNQCWTLFLNAANFSGPVAFYMPEVWSRIAKGYPIAEGRGLDAKPGIAGGGAMEVNTVPLFESKDSKGTLYSKIPQLQFPINKEGNTVLMQDVTMYSSKAIYDDVNAWLRENKNITGRFDAAGAYPAYCTTGPISLKQGEQDLPIKGVDEIVETTMLGPSTFGLHWKKAKGMGYFPNYFKEDGKAMLVVDEKVLPKETGLKQASFAPAVNKKAYYSPKEKGTVWTNPGPQSGPYQVHLNDGSVITYCWYKFIDQPSLQGLHLTTEAKQRLQKIVEFMHANWKANGQYMAAPSQGKLAALDKAILVSPPPGLEIGYVPVVIRQEADKH